MTDLKIFLKAPLAPTYTSLEGGARAEKTQFFGEIFPKKWPKNAFLACFFEILPAAQKFRAKQGLAVLWDSSKNQFGRPEKEKGRQKFQFF